MRKTISAILTVLMLVLVSGCVPARQSTPAAATALPASAPTPAPLVTAWPIPDWQTSSPEQQGMSSARLADMLEAIRTSQLNVDSVLVIRNGYIVLEAYANPYGPADRHTVESNTKSVVAALIGIAVDRGIIKSADEKLVSFFPDRLIDNLDERKKAISLHNLLSMQPGLDCQDQTPAAQGMYQTQVWVQYLLDLPMAADPGKQWVYCSGASHLLSAVLGAASGMDARSFANQNLFGPLGVSPVEAFDWGADPQGVSSGVAGLYLTPRELARFGLLYLNKGVWNGKQLVPGSWVEKSTTEQAFIGKDPYVGNLDRRFGYMFSIFPDQEFYGYLGMAGQELFILPRQNMVVVFNSGLQVGKEAALLELVNQYIVPAAQSTAALPENIKEQSWLAADIAQMKEPRHPIDPLPQTAMQISGKKYQVDQNLYGWSDLTFEFMPGEAEAVVKLTGLPSLAIGLDGLYRRTEIPKARPIALRGTWQGADTLVLENITVGEFQKQVITIQFAGKDITLTAQEQNFGTPPVVVHGKQAG